MIILHVCCLMQALVRNFTHVESGLVFCMIYATTEYNIHVILNEHKYKHFPLKLFYFPHAIQLILAAYKMVSSHEPSLTLNPVLVTSVISVNTRRLFLWSESRKYRPYVTVGLSSKWDLNLTLCIYKASLEEGWRIFQWPPIHLKTKIQKSEHNAIHLYWIHRLLNWY